MNVTENRPWGNYTILLDDNDCKVKTIIIKSGESPSYQYHFKRKEHWIIIQGSGILILNDIERIVNAGDCIFVDKLEKHKIFGVVESVKAVSDLFSPLSGTVTHTNQELVQNPEWVNADPMSKAWMIKVSVENPSELTSLMTEEAYEKYLKEEVK